MNLSELNWIKSDIVQCELVCYKKVLVDKGTWHRKKSLCINELNDSDKQVFKCDGINYIAIKWVY